MTNLVIDIGNSSVKASFANGMSLEEVVRFDGEDVAGFIWGIANNREIAVIAVSSVRKFAEGFFNQFTNLCQKLIVVDHSTEIPLINRYKSPTTLGTDRLIAAVAAAELFPGRKSIIFDFGTALTIDFIGENREFSGGNISLGMRSRFRALHDYTERLPLINTPVDVVDIGGNTSEAVASGVILGLIFEIEGYMKSYPEYIYIFTGGDAIYFAEKLKSSIFVVYNLVLMGLARVAEYYAKS